MSQSINRRHFLRSAAMHALVAASLLCSATAQPPPGQEPARRSLSLDEMIIIQDFFKGEGARLVPMMDAMQARIPPTYLKRNVVGRPLTPEIRKFVAAIPKELARKLPVPPSGLQLAILGRRVILISTGEQVLHDALVIKAPASATKKKN